MSDKRADPPWHLTIATPALIGALLRDGHQVELQADPGGDTHPVTDATDSTITLTAGHIPVGVGRSYRIRHRKARP